MCLAAYAGLHGVILSRVRRLTTASLDMMYAPLDKRGKHTNRPRKLPDSVKRQIDAHVCSFPTMRSHYSRGKQSRRRKYLSPVLNVALMHELYLKKFEPAVDKPLVTYEAYRSSVRDLPTAQNHSSLLPIKQSKVSDITGLWTNMSPLSIDLFSAQSKVTKRFHLMNSAHDLLTPQDSNSNVLFQNCILSVFLKSVVFVVLLLMLLFPMMITSYVLTLTLLLCACGVLAKGGKRG